MKFNLLIFEGTDLVKFGMASEEIQAILKIKPRLFKKTEFDLLETEDYHNICHVFYEAGKNGKLVCAAVELFNPSQVFLDGIQLIGEKRKKIEDLFNTKFEDCLSDTSGSSSKKYDVSFYSTEETVASVFVARKGYCSEQEAFYKKAFEKKYSIPQKGTDMP